MNFATAADVEARMPGGIPFDVWIDTIDHIKETKKVAALGRRAYEAFYGEDVSSHQENLELLRVLADLLHKAFENLDASRAADLKECLEGKGEFFETTFWEEPRFRGEAHLLLEREISSKMLPTPTLLELLLIAHDLEASIRPNLFRIVWAAKLAAGDRSTKYSDSQLNPERRQGSLGYALKQISEWLDSTDASRRILEPSGIEALRSFHQTLAGHEEDQASLDEIRNAMAHRDFMIGPTTVVMGFHPTPGRRQTNDRANVTVWRRQTLGLMSLAYGFSVMFLAHAAARCGEIRPAFRPR